MTYPYFQALATAATNLNEMRPRGSYLVPSTATVDTAVPQLFIYGKNKHYMYHDESYLDFLEQTPGCGFCEFGNDGHWLQISSPKRLAKELLLFIESDSYESKRNVMGDEPVGEVDSKKTK